MRRGLQDELQTSLPLSAEAEGAGGAAEARRLSVNELQMGPLVTGLAEKRPDTPKNTRICSQLGGDAKPVPFPPTDEQT